MILKNQTNISNFFTRNSKRVLQLFVTAAFFISFAHTAYAGPIEDLQPNTWLEIPNTNMSMEYPTPTPIGNSGPKSVMSAWSGGAFDTTRNRLIVWGGGHLDYSGNELYAFDINTFTWTRITEPSDPAPRCELYMPDGNPGSHHTYNLLQYSENLDGFVSLSGGGWGSNCPDDFKTEKLVTTDIYDFTSNTWIQAAQQPSAGHTTGRVTAVDPATGHIWLHGTQNQGRLIEYNTEKNEWKTHTDPNYLRIGGTAAIDPVRRLMVSVGGYNNNRQFRVWALSEQATPISVTTSGDTTLETSDSPGFEYDPILEKFVGWHGGSSVYILDPDTWVWTKIDASAGNTAVPSAEARGTYGRFRYIPSKNAYILVNRTTENVFFYKLNNQTPVSKPGTVQGVSTTVNLF